VGFPTLRLVRASIGNVRVEGLALGESREIEASALWNRSPQSPGG
jgi:16S rRNA U516 pseudouridylate synthase RsuA-like enzyme